LNGIRLSILHNIARLVYRLPRVSFEARLVEYDFAHANLLGDGQQRILDIGCGGSKLPIELARQGYYVCGIDVEDYDTRGLFTFVKGDIRQMPFDDDYFDTVTAISTIEHIGLGRYGDPIAPYGDLEAMGEIRRVIKPGGHIIITIPFGEDTICYTGDGVPLHRAYSCSSLMGLLSGYDVLELAYIAKKKLIWFPVSVSQVEKMANEASPDKAGMTTIALINARKTRP